MKQIEVVARSREQAITRAASRLEADASKLVVLEEYDPDELDLKDLEEYEATLSEDDRAEGEPVLYLVSVKATGEEAERLRAWAEGLVQLFQTGSRVELVQTERKIQLLIQAEEASIFIGKQGQTLAALQHIVARIAVKILGDRTPVALDIGDYRDRRTRQLEKLAESLAKKALRTRRNVAMRPMPAADRKLVHNFLKGMTGITTISEGHEPNRYILIQVPGGDRPHREREHSHGHGHAGHGGGHRQQRQWRKAPPRGEGGERNYNRAEPVYQRPDVDGNRAERQRQQQQRELDGNRWTRRELQPERHDVDGNLLPPEEIVHDQPEIEGNIAPPEEHEHFEELDGNRWDAEHGRGGGGAGAGRRAGKRRRGGRKQQERKGGPGQPQQPAHDPYAEQRRKLREAQESNPVFYEDVPIEETASRLPTWQDKGPVTESSKMEDELED